MESVLSNQHKCKTCPWFTYSDHIPPKDNSIGICKYFMTIATGRNVCAEEDFAKVEQAYLVWLERLEPLEKAV